MENDIVNQDIQKIKKVLEPYKDKIKGKTFLVTGGAGFLGSWFCDVLNEFNAKIICVDNLASGISENIKHLISNKNFKFINADICTFSTDEKLDYVVHMASIASPSIYHEHPIQTLDANVIGTKNMLELARKNNIKSFLFTSTSEVYGNPPNDKVPTPENYYGNVNSYGPRSMYDEGKRVAESYCYVYFKKFDLPIRVARIFNTFGPRIDMKNPNSYARSLGRFIWKANNDETIEIWSDGKQTRSFCYITDQIEGLLKLLLTPAIDGEVVNIGSKEEISILDLAKLTVKISGSKSKFEFNPGPEFMKEDPMRRCPDLAKAKKLLNFEPEITLEEGLEKTIEWFRSVQM